MSAPIKIGNDSENVILERLTRDKEPGRWIVSGSFRVARVQGSFESVLLRPDGFVQSLEQMNQIMRGEASLHGVDEDLSVKLSINKRGEVRVAADIDDHHSHNTSITFSLDQTYLPALIAACRVNGWDI